jgi:hypothetical protein
MAKVLAWPRYHNDPRSNTSVWYLTNTQQHWKVDELLAEPSEAGDSSVGGTSCGSIAEPAPIVNAAAASSSNPDGGVEFNIVVRKSATKAGCWFMYHKELRMSRWLELQRPLPDGVSLEGWEIGEQDGHEYVIPKLSGSTNEQDIQDNAMWVPCVSYSHD